MKNTKLLLLITLFLNFSMSLAAQSRISITHGPYLQGLTEDEVTIVWTTNKRAIVGGAGSGRQNPFLS